MDPNCDAEYWNSGLEWHEKDIVVHKQDIFRALPLKPGDIVADVGAGTGQFEKGLSEIVGANGKVYAIDIASAFIPYMKDRFVKENLTNVEVILGKAEKTTLPANSVNMVFVVDTYHHFDNAKDILRDFKKILRAEGHLVIVDFKTGPQARPWVNEHVGISREEIIKEVTAGGFEFLREEKIPFIESFQLTFKRGIH
jgi:ubiquinone/menaquinone biosynthesis C-methylase UbiE